MHLILFILVTALSFLTANGSIVENLLKKWYKSPSAPQRQLLKEKEQLQQQQSKTNMMDEFAKYSKIQRKINAIDQQLEEHTDTNNSIWWKLGMSYGPRVVCAFVLLVLSVVYRKTPLFQLPSYVNLAPLDYFISYPNGKNDVSLHFWILSCNAAAKTVKLGGILNFLGIS